MPPKAEVIAAAEKALRGVRGSWLHYYIAKPFDAIHEAPSVIQNFVRFETHGGHEVLWRLVRVELDERCPPRET